MGGYLEKNSQTLQDVQAKLGEQSKGMTHEMWTQFMSLQTPVLQGVINNNLEQSKNMFVQVQVDQAQLKALTPQLKDVCRHAGLQPCPARCFWHGALHLGFRLAFPARPHAPGLWHAAAALRADGA